MGMKTIGRNRLPWWVVMVILLQAVVSGCTAQIQQAADLSRAGVEYAGAMDALLGATSSIVVDADSELLLYEYSLVSYPDDKKKERTTLAGYLKSHGDALKPLIALLSEFRTRMQHLKNYFASLEALANSDAPKELSTAVQSLSSNLGAANTTFRTLLNDASPDVVLSNAENTAIGKLAGLVGEGIQAEMLREALKRDAPIIGEHLVLTQKLLDKISAMVVERHENAMILKMKNDVQKPFKEKKIDKPDRWMKIRKAVLIDSDLNAALQKAQSASARMNGLWEGILKGSDRSMPAIQLVLSDIQEFSGLVKQLKPSE